MVHRFTWDIDYLEALKIVEAAVAKRAEELAKEREKEREEILGKFSYQEEVKE